jgi:hypothetical protein
MSDLEAMNKVKQTMPIFNEIARHLETLTKSKLYFIRAFYDGHFYPICNNTQLISDLSKVKRGVIFGDRNFTGLNDWCKFFCWPPKPQNENMEAFHKNNQWYGITLAIPGGYSYGDFLGLGTGLDNVDMQDFYLSMKDEILRLTWCFYKRIRSLLYLPTKSTSKELFKFKLGSDFTEPAGQRLEEQRNFQRAVIATELGTDDIGEKERMVYLLWRHGVSPDRIAQLLGWSPNAVRMHVKSIQDKGGQCYRANQRTDLLIRR